MFLPFLLFSPFGMAPSSLKWPELDELELASAGLSWSWHELEELTIINAFECYANAGSTF